MLDIRITGYDNGPIGCLSIIRAVDALGQDCWVLFDPRQRDPYAGGCLQREYSSFEEAMDEYDQIVLQAAVAHIKSVKATYAAQDYHGSL